MDYLCLVPECGESAKLTPMPGGTRIADRYLNDVASFCDAIHVTRRLHITQAPAPQQILASMVGIVLLVAFSVVILAAIFLGAILVDGIQDDTGYALMRRYLLYGGLD